MSAAPDLKPLIFPDDEDEGMLDLQFDPTLIRPVTPYTEDIDDEYKAAQVKLRELSEQQEATQKLASELEELSRKEHIVKTSRTELSEELNRSLSLLEREAAEARKRAADCSDAAARVETHLNHITNLRPDLWDRSERKMEIVKALSIIEDAESELDAIQPILENTPKKQGFLPQGKLFSQVFSKAQGDFVQTLKFGVAFFLPLAVIGLFAFIIYLFL